MQHKCFRDLPRSESKSESEAKQKPDLLTPVAGSGGELTLLLGKPAASRVTWVTFISSVVSVLLFQLALFEISGQLCGKVSTFLNSSSLKVMLLGKRHRKSNQIL